MRGAALATALPPPPAGGPPARPPRRTESLVVVTDHLHFTVTRPGGTFWLDNVPAGPYTLEAWRTNSNLASDDRPPERRP